MTNAALILSTVNASFSQKLDAQALANCLLHQQAALAVPGHMSAFFGEVNPTLQAAFADLVNVSQAELIAAAKAFAEYSGETYPLAA
jgi:hypothetical protein